jgi:8-oxo-dGTP pyrophosphatase MutT (NUDIX family)
LREGEVVHVDGTAGSFSIDGVPDVSVVTAFLEQADGRILLLHRSAHVGTFRERWAGVSGYVEESTPLRQAIREIREETRIDVDARDLLSEGPPLAVREASKVFVVYPFRFRAGDERFHLDREHSRAEWVLPAEIGRRSTVPKLDRAWEAVAPSAVAHRQKS